MKKIRISNKLLLSLLACFIICYIATFFFDPYGENSIIFGSHGIVNLFNIIKEHGWLCDNDDIHYILQSGYTVFGFTLYILVWVKLFSQTMKLKGKKTWLWVLLMIPHIIFAFPLLILFMIIFLWDGIIPCALLCLLLMYICWKILKSSGKWMMAIFPVLFIVSFSFVYKTIDLPGPIDWTICDRPFDFPSTWLGYYFLFRWGSIFRQALLYATAGLVLIRVPFWIRKGFIWLKNREKA